MRNFLLKTTTRETTSWMNVANAPEVLNPSNDYTNTAREPFLTFSFKFACK